MKSLQETTHGTDLGKLEPQTSFQALVAGEQLDVLGTIAPEGLKQNQGFDIFGLRATTLALLEFEIGGDQVRNFEGAEGPRSGEQTGVWTGHLPEGTGIQGKGRLM